MTAFWLNLVAIIIVCLWGLAVRVGRSDKAQALNTVAFGLLGIGIVNIFVCVGAAH